MKNKILGILICTLLMAASTVVVADWDPEDGHKMHNPQLPDPNGWDVHATAPIQLGDDWKCSETGYVKDIHIWGSWLGDDKGIIDSFYIAIYTNDPGPPSKPKDLKWEREITNWVERGPYTGDQGWYWPENDEYWWHDHQLYYQYNFFLDEPWFLQEKDTIYWLVISANVRGGTWGWKSSKFHFEDDACWRAPGGDWIEMYEPEPPVTNQFWLTMMYTELVEAGGTDYFDDGTSFNGWYYYPYRYPDWWWWNIWFYNAPFSYDKYKEIYVSFICDPISPDPVFFVINWATDYWEPGGPPPLPRDVQDPEYEDMVIGRWPGGQQPIPVEPGFNEFWFTIPDYNPEWVSIDFMGNSFTIVEGIIIHQCLPPEHAESLDLAFVITGEPAEEPCVDIEKKVWDEDNNDWVEEIDAAVCTNVEFKIDIHNCGDPDLTEIYVLDTLPDCLEYVTGSSTVDGNPQEPTVAGNQLKWLLPGPLAFCNTITIKFKAHVISIGENINTVTVDTQEGASDSDTATVNGIGIPHVDIKKQVSTDGGATWSDEVTQKVCENVRFRITVHNDGDYDLTNIKVVDILPDCLEYKDNAIPKEPDSIVGNKLTWTFPGPLTYCNTITIEFDAHVISEGENINEATVTADSAGGSVTGTATATVWGGEPIPKIGCGGTLRWTSVTPGSTQTGTITVSNIGDPGSQLRWKKCGEPTWGSWTFTPSSGTGLTPAMGPLTITVTVVAPTQQNQQYSGQITLCNEDDSTDTCSITVSLATPKSKILYFGVLVQLFERFPLLKLLFYQLFIEI